MLPLLNIEHMYGASVYKEVLKRRGVIRTAVMRGGVPLDDFDQRELDGILGEMGDLFRVSLFYCDGRAAPRRCVLRVEAPVSEDLTTRTTDRGNPDGHPRTHAQRRLGGGAEADPAVLAGEGHRQVRAHEGAEGQ